jgi:hypothetical protein
MNRAHISSDSDGFEWWYLQISSSEYAVTLTVRTTELLGGPLSKPYLSSTIAWFDGHILNDRIPFAKEDLTSAGQLLTVAGWLKEDTSGWQISLRRNDWSLVGRMHRSSAAWRTGHTMISESADGHRMHWVVPMPRAAWSGKLVTRGRSSATPGWAYQDHNWGNAPLEQLIRSWRWHAVGTMNYTDIQADVLQQTGCQQTFALRVLKNGEIDSHRPNAADWREYQSIIKSRQYRSPHGGAAFYSRQLVGAVSGPDEPKGFCEAFSFRPRELPK